MRCGSALAPIIQYVTNLVYQLMKAIQSVIYALTGVNIFANASAKAYASMASNAKKAKNETKQLAGVHDEINNIQSNNDSGSGDGATAPNMDLSGLDTQLSPWQQKLYEFFKPLIDSWNTYGSGLIAQIQTTAGQVVGLISSVWGSFEKIITNGTIYTTLELILAIIGNIAESFANAWNAGSIGNQIVQNLFNSFNNILGIINQIAQSQGIQILFSSALKILNSIIKTIDNIATAFANAWNYNSNGDVILTTISNMLEKIQQTIQNIAGSTGFQTFLNGVMTAFSGILQFLEPVLTDFFSFIEPITEIAMSTVGTVLGAIGDALSWIGNNEIAVTILESLALAIGLVVGAIAIWNAVTTGFGIAVQIATSPITLIVLAIAALIAIIILCIKHWDQIKETVINVVGVIKDFIVEKFNAIKDFFVNVFNSIKDFFVNIWNSIKDFFVNLCISIYTKQQEIWNKIKDTISNVITAIKDFFINIWNSIKDFFINICVSIYTKSQEIWNNIKNAISNVINGIKTTISNVLNTIKNIWNNIWNGLKTTVTNIFNGIWNAIKKVINSILGGIEGMANGVVSGVNLVIRTLNKLKFTVPDWVPGLGGKTFGFNLSEINKVSLPRLAKGGVLYEDTIVQAGEYAGARSNPEIVTPQNIMYDTMKKALSDSGNNLDNGRPLHITIQYLGKTIFDDTIEYINDKTRRTGKDTIITVGG